MMVGCAVAVAVGGGASRTDDRRDEDDELLLTLVVIHCAHADLAEALLRRGADVSLQTNVGGTALGLAASNGYEKMVELALRHGAEINQRSKIGNTALMAAAYRGDLRVADTLIRHGAEINLQANHGDTALMFAAVNHPAMVLRLLRAGADMALRGSGGTALQIAKEKGHAECVEAFRTYLGEVATARSFVRSSRGGG